MKNAPFPQAPMMTCRPSFFVLLALGAAVACTSPHGSSAHATDSTPGNDAGDGAHDTTEGSFGPHAGDPTENDGGLVVLCSPSPANVEVPGNGCDDDANGKVDDATSCDDALPLTGDADDFARALGLCNKASSTSWGVVSARYTNGFSRTTPPADGQHGLLDGFGAVVEPREGKRLGVLSTGWAREYDSSTNAQKTPFNSQPEFAMQREPVPGLPKVLVETAGDPPPGWPKAAGGCPALSSATFDSAAVHLTIKAPANARGIRFDFSFLSGEWPEWVCSTYNDGFVAMLSSKANPSGTPWQNISFDAKNNPVSVNFAFFDHCTPNVKTSCKQSAPQTSVCALGPAELAGTGFAIVDDYCGYGTESTGGGSTGWLVSEAPVVAGETLELRFVIWDTGDFKFDSSVLIDHLQWIPVEQAPVPAPKTERAPPVVH
jgi:hypothetical protein